VRALGAELWKMFAGDLFLTLGTLATVAGVALLLRAHATPAPETPYLLAAIVVGVFVAAVVLSTAKEIKRKSDR
jgi:multisubunit Na+/H+ antiporter MnhC subunit